MSKHIKITMSFLFGAVFFLLSYFCVNAPENTVSESDTASVEKILHHLQTESRKTVSDIISMSDGDESPNIDSICPKNLQEKGIFIFITDSLSDKILYWSNNLPVRAEKLKIVSDDPQYMFLGNAWYVVQARWCDGTKYITLILVAQEYMYQNRFLVNETNAALNLSENIVVQPLDADIGIPVKGIDGAPIFALNSYIYSSDALNTALVLRWLTFVFVFAALMFIFLDSALYRRNLAYLALFLLVLVGLRILLTVNSKYFSGQFYLFSPMLYADSELFSSLGGLLLHVLFMMFFIIALFLAKQPLLDRLNRASNSKNRLFYVIFCILTSLFLCFVLYISQSLVVNSEISFKIHKMNNITAYTFVGYFILGTVFAQLCLFLWFQSFLFSALKKTLQLIVPSITALVAAVATDGVNCESLFIAALYIFINFLFVNDKTRTLSLFFIVWIVAFVSLYASFSLIDNTMERERKKRTLLAQDFLSERDPVAEVMLKDMENSIYTDPYICNVINSDRKKSLYNILIDKYFKGYFQRYDLHLTVCKPNENLHIVDENKYENCIDFFEKQCRNQNCVALSGSEHFRFMNNYWGRIHYLGSFKFATGADTTFMFMDLYLKHEIKTIGYPELLKFEAQSVDNFTNEEYSYAKYANGILVAKFGSYDYSFELTQKAGESGFFDRNGYSHYIFNSGDGNAVILSQANPDFYGIVSTFSYSFVIFLMIFLLMFTVSGQKPEIPSKNSYRRRISLVILVGIIGSLTALTVAMIAYTVSQSEKNNKEDIQSKMQSVVIELENLIDKKPAPETVAELEQTLVRLSNAFYTDLNLYDISGDLIASSRNEMFEKNLIGTKMNREAFRALSIEKQSKFIHTERIGKMNYFSSYLICYSKDGGEAISFLNLPYFDKQFKVRNELLSLTGAIMNIYIFLIVIGIALSVFVSNQITRPLDLVRRKMSKLTFNEPPEPIDYKANNELGDLVREYNRMIEELAESAKIMAENERESAWREMARQIAHEIKNPLTPMKLNIQFALRMKSQNRDGWQDKMESAMKSILEQIDILTNIASEFSNFARTGKVELEPLDLAMSVVSGMSLFSGYRNIALNFDRDENKKYTVKANREQLHRVLTNLIKNSIQATENVSTPSITLSLNEESIGYILRVSDNGTGISEQESKNLFRPNFTTKSGGTGLGLAISKGIIESFGGTITCIPQTIGACFEIRLPKLG